MKCKSLGEKWKEAWEEFVRMFKIAMICIAGTTIFALALALSMTMKENKEMKETIEVMKQEDSEKEDRKENTKYIVVMDEITGEVVYAYYK